MTMADTGEGESCRWWLVIGCGVVTFVLVNYITDLLVPASASNTRQQRWKWRNVATSFIHSLITGLWALAAFYKAPDMKDDLQRKFTISSHTLVCFSIGYFLYDAVDMVINHRKRSTYELLLHHGLVILCYSVAVISRQFVAFVALSLIVEVNSVFLHARQLFIITSQPKGSLRYKANALLNVVTFLFFRLILLAYMTCWLASQRSTISFGFLAVGFVGLGVIDIMNIILFCRILYTDMEVFLFQCSKLPDTISVEKVTLLEAELDEHSISKILSSEEKEEEEDSSNIQSNSFNTNNQNFVNGCQKRKEWSPENLVRD